MTINPAEEKSPKLRFSHSDETKTCIIRTSLVLISRRNGGDVVRRSIRYEEWMQRLLLKSPETTGVSQHVLEEFIRIWGERVVETDGRKLLDLEDAG